MDLKDIPIVTFIQQVNGGPGGEPIIPIDPIIPIEPVIPIIPTPSEELEEDYEEDYLLFTYDLFDD